MMARLKGYLARDVLKRGAPRFNHSSSYWDERYRRSGNSGAGSYGRLADFKAATMNQLIQQYGAKSMVEWGCGDGAQLCRFEVQRYLGIDVSPEAIGLCRRRFANDASRQFMTLDDANRGPLPKMDLSVSLDVIYHLVEDDTYDTYMGKLFSSAAVAVVVYASNFDERWSGAHIRHREFTAWVDRHRPDWHLAEHLPNPYPFDPRNERTTSFADFYVFTRAAK